MGKRTSALRAWPNRISSCTSLAAAVVTVGENHRSRCRFPDTNAGFNSPLPRPARLAPRPDLLGELLRCHVVGRKLHDSLEGR